jgi:hypothetical protein
MYLSVIMRDGDLIDGRPRWHYGRNIFRAAERGDVLILASNLIQAEVTGHGEVRSAQPNTRPRTLFGIGFSLIGSSGATWTGSSRARLRICLATSSSEEQTQFT